MEGKLEFLLDRSSFEEDKVALLDRLTIAMKNSTPDSKAANDIWSLLKDDHYFWYNAGKVLAMSQVDETKIYMLIILENAIKQKWYALPEEQKQGIRSYIVNLVLQYGAVQGLPRTKHNILSKANSTLIQIVKYEWDTSWKSFISDICTASMKDMNICENNFYILKMLSEQIFDYSKNQLTQQQVVQLKQQMNTDFTTIFQLCRLILNNMHQAKNTLLKACLETLHAFLSWVPIYFIIYTDLIDKLVQLLASDFLRNLALSCLVEIAGLKIDESRLEEKQKFLFMLRAVTAELSKLLPISNDEAQVQSMLQQAKKRNRNVFEILARGITNFYSQFLANQHSWLNITVTGHEEYLQVCYTAFKYILMMMKIDEDQVFKIAIEFFHDYISRFLQEGATQSIIGGETLMSQGLTLASLYPQIFQKVMHVVVLKMAKPEEVLIVIDEDGIPVREELANTENSSLYQIEKELASYLVRYDWDNMRKFILSQISKQQNPEYFSFDLLNSLSWIVGSLCGFIMDKEERTFFISALKTLLQLCEMKKGKDNKAVIASCIMYIVGQYPTFLRINWTFLKTVVKKLFEFMKEDFPGIMDMACNAFLKIARSNADQFVQCQSIEPQPYIREILRRIPEHSKKLEHQALKLIFFESVGYMIGAETNSSIQLDLMKQSLGEHLFEFINIVEMIQTNPNLPREQQIAAKLLFFFKLNEALATSIGRNYVNLLSMFSEYFNKFYLYYSQEVNNSVILDKNSINFTAVRQMRAVKKAVVRIYIKLLQRCTDLNVVEAARILSQFIFPLGTLLKDFQNCIPETKEQQFVMLFTIVLQNLSSAINAEFLSNLIEMVFASSLPLITSDFNSFPQIRFNFFAFLKSLIKFNFGLLFTLKEEDFNTILDCVVWSFRHELSTYSDLGLDLLEEILLNVNKNTHVANVFYMKYHMKILTEVLDVMTDGFHKSGLEAQSKIFFILIHVTTQKILTNPISPDQQPLQSNQEFLFSFLLDRLSTTFNNLDRNSTATKIALWFKKFDEKQFKLQIADYLILINRFQASEVQAPKV